MPQQMSDMPSNFFQRTIILRQRVTDQRKWIDSHGGDLHGYIMRYGSKSDPEHYGDGGEAIYAADKNDLLKLQSQLRAAENRARR